MENDVYSEVLGENISSAEETQGKQYGNCDTCDNECDNAGNNVCRNASDGQPKDGILDLIYGVFFEPARTFAGLSNQPALRTTVIIVVFLELAIALMAFFDVSQQYATEIAISAPLFVVGVVFIALIKWFFMTGLLHLVAAFYGGWGDVRSVFAVYGLAGLPAVLMIPLELLTIILAPGMALSMVTVLLTLVVLIWSVVLLIIGIREVHGFSSEKAALTVFTPVLAVVGMFIVGLIMFGSVLANLNL